jgi:hypothetical protein
MLAISTDSGNSCGQHRELTAAATFAPVPRQELYDMARKLREAVFLASWLIAAILIIAFAISHSLEWQ